MTDVVTVKFFRRTLMAGAAAVAVLVGFTAAPTLFTRSAEAQEIATGAVTPPGGAPMSFADLIERVRPAVVSIQVRQRPDAATGTAPEGLPPGFEDFFQGRPGRPGPAPVSLGSGFFIDQRGTIVTNHHVVQGAEEIVIRTSDGRELQAELVGSDEPTDLAVIRIRDGGRFQFVAFDDASHLRVGDWVVAVGNPFGLDGTATAGIVSAVGRRDAGSSSYVDFLQIDAPINRGNSGGPTFDLNGNVVGVNSQILSPTGGSVGIGFAIPANTARAVVEQLTRNGRVTRGWLGVSIQDVDEDIARSLGLDDARGALIGSITAGGPAERAGLQQGDVVLSFNGERIQDRRDLTQRVGATAVNATTRLEVMRDGQRRTINVRLGERPSEQVLASATPTPQATPEQPSQQQGAAQGALGMSVRPLTIEDRSRYQLAANESGLVITTLDPNSDAAEKAIRAGDVILQAGGRSVRTLQELNTAVEAARRASRPILLQVDGRLGRRFVAVDLGGN